ncbi:MAG TPA: tetratricopeptide repeat protein [Chthoniobacterales bacterium]
MLKGTRGSNPRPSGLLVRLIALLLGLAAPAVAQQQQPATIDNSAIELARRQFESGKANEAVATLDSFEQRNGATGRSLDLRGRIAMEGGQLDEAAKLFTAARDKDEASLGQLHFGDLLLREKKFADAREAYRRGTRQTNILGIYERLRFGMLLTYLAEKNDADAQESLGQIRFPSESGAYYYAQAAWAYAHGQTRDAEKWIKRCEDIFGSKVTPWFANRFYDVGWIKAKPATTGD